MAGAGAGVVHIPLDVAHVPVLVVTDRGLPDGHEVDHTAIVGRLLADGVARTVVQSGMTVGVLADVHTALRGGVRKKSLASQTLSYEQSLPR